MTTYLNLQEHQINFERAQNGAYFHNILPTSITPGLLLEVQKIKNQWVGSIVTYTNDRHCTCHSPMECPHRSVLNTTEHHSPCHMAPIMEMANTQSTIKATHFQALIDAMKRPFETISQAKNVLNSKESALLSLVCESVWRFPKIILQEIEPA